MVQLNLSLPTDFLQPEIRNEYFISTEMKKVWAVELDLLNKLLQVAQSHNIPLWVGDDTLLGTIRHQGMIPWDDDIDVIMFREDYDKLCRIAPKEFVYPYFFQTSEIDPWSLRGHAQLRRSDTLGMLKGDSVKYPFNQGIFIDLFPIDNKVDDQSLFIKQLEKAKHYRGLAMTSRSVHFLSDKSLPAKKRIKRFIKKILIGNLYAANYFARKETAYRTLYNNLQTDEIMEYVLAFDRKEKYVYNRQWFAQTVYPPFEFLTVPVPIGYEEILTKVYGNWHEFVKGTSAHGGVIFNTEIGYKDYIKQVDTQITNLR